MLYHYHYAVNDMALGGFFAFPCGDPICLDFEATTVNAVPLPGSGWLLMIGMAGLMMRRQETQ